MIVETITILAVTIAVVLALSGIIIAVCRKPEVNRRWLGWFLVAAVIIWFALALRQSIYIGVGPILAAFILVPISVGLIASFFDPFRTLLAKTPPHWLILLQTYRIEGAIFLFVYLTQGTLSRGFALNAGIGDVLTGLFAVPVGLMVRKRSKYYLAAAIAWNIFGVGDLIVAPASAIAFGAQALNSFPVSLVPLFAGPPLGILLHILSLRTLFIDRKNNWDGQPRSINRADVSADRS